MSLSSIVRSLREKDPLGLIVLWTPSHTIGRWAIHRLAEENRSLLNVRAETTRTLLTRLCEPRLASRSARPVPSFVRRWMLEKIIRENAEGFRYFGPVSRRPGFVSALGRTFEDMRQGALTSEVLDGLCRERKGTEGSAKLEDIALVARLLKRGMEKENLFEWQDLLELLSSEGPPLTVPPTVILTGFRRLTRIETGLAEWISGRTRLVLDLPGTLLLPPGQWKSLTVCLKKGTSTGTEPPPAFAADLRIASCPNDIEEMKWIARQILQFAENGVAFNDILVSFHDLTERASLVRRVFNASGIPYYLECGRPLIEHPIVAKFVAFLKTRASGGSRNAVIDFFKRRSFFETSPDNAGRRRPDEWDYISRQAGITGGEVSEWLRALKSLEEDWREGKGRNIPADLPGMLEQRSLLVEALNGLEESLKTFPGEGTMTEWMRCALNAIRPHLSPSDVDYLSEHLGPLTEKTVDSATLNFDDFLRSFEQWAGHQTIHDGSERLLHGGVHVVSTETAAAMPARIVIVGGLTEKVFPREVLQDPVLLDEEKRAVMKDRPEVTLTLASDGYLREKEVFSSITRRPSATLLLSYARLSYGTGQSLIPSSFLLDLLKEKSGRLVTYGEMESHPQVHRLSSTLFPEMELARANSSSDYEQVSLIQAIHQADLVRAAHLLSHNEIFRRVLSAEEQKWTTEGFGEHDGAIGGAVGHKKLEDFVRRGYLSPTGIEAYADCPYRFMLSRLLRIEKTEDPEACLTIRPSQRGDLIHDALYRLFQGLRESGLLPYDPAKKEEYLRLTEKSWDEALRNFERRGNPVLPSLWNIEKDAILRDLGKWLWSEVNHPSPYVPSDFEYDFGRLDKEVFLTFDGVRVPITGRIDRVDRTPDGRKVMISDYKTGSVKKKFHKDETLNPQSAQLPLYALAYEKVNAGVRVERAQYIYCTSGGRFTRIVYSEKTLEQARPFFEKLVAGFAGFIQEGFFPACPSDRCKMCDFLSVCGPGRETVFEIKRSDERMASLEKLLDVRAGTDSEEDEKGKAE
ncbi:MAG TPA: PD-(D/E)XK nuclease family protein [Elusimicrobiota bacterium]|nr:PD-(D/E)XK nuclease family protein [Elusimicrobiota bacterium]